MNEQIVTAVEVSLHRAGVLHRDAVFLAALSGGADSVALLLAMHTLAGRHGFAVRAAHVEHGLRGETSLRDAAFCQELCRSLGVPYTCDHAALTGDMHDAGVEARARAARYALLLHRARECKADALLLAHHQDDQAETVLAHLLRGSGARGLAGMRPCTRREGVLLVRPLLDVPKTAILEALGNQPYCMDESNVQLCCQRNRLRLTVLPMLTAENPQTLAHMAQSARLLAMDEDALTAQAETALAAALFDTPPYYCLRKERLTALPDAVALRVLRAFAQRGMETVLAADAQAAPEERALSAEDSLALLSLLHAPPGTDMNLPHGLRAVGTGRFIHLVRMADGAPLTPKDTPEAMQSLPADGCVVFDGYEITVSPNPPENGKAPDGASRVAVPLALLQNAALRTARPGDVVRPFGAPGSKPLRRYFTDQKIDLPFRARVPLLCVENRVLWAVGVGAAEETRLTREPAVWLSVSPPPPWQTPGTV